MCDQGVHERAVGRRWSESEWRCGGAYSHSLGSAHQAAQDPVTRGSVEFYLMLDGELGRYYGIEW